MGFETKTSNVIYASILDADATFRLKAEEGDDGAVERIIEKKDGTKRQVWEFVSPSYSGYLLGVKKKTVTFGSGRSVDFFEILMKDIIEDNPNASIQMPFSSEFATDFMKKLPNIIPDTSIRIKPYNFLGDKGRNIKGVTVYQNDKKLTNFFFDPELKANLHGFPELGADFKTFEKEDWVYHFTKIRKWLYKYYEENLQQDYFGDTSSAYTAKPINTESASQRPGEPDPAPAPVDVPHHAEYDPQPEEDNSPGFDPTAPADDLPF